MICTVCAIDKPETEYYKTYKQCKDCARAKVRAYMQERRATYRAKSKRYHKANRTKLITRMRERNTIIRNEVLLAYGGLNPTCVCCGEKQVEFLAVDHINGGGNKHRNELNRNSGSGFYRWLRKNNFPEGFQLLCWNCNFGKHRYGECPHLRKSG